MRLISTGKALPSLSLSADDLDRLHGFPTGYTLARSGVTKRYFASAQDSQAALGAQALHHALERADLGVENIDLLIGACALPIQALPGSANFIAHAAGLPTGLPVFDVNSSCLSFITALHVANALLQLGSYRRIAIVSVDFASRGLDWDIPESSLIFGDGAAAVIVEAGSGSSAIRSYSMQTFTRGRHFCEIRAGGTAYNPIQGISNQDYLFSMQGKAVFRLVFQEMPAFMEGLMAQVDGGLDSLDCIIPHQASYLGMQHMFRRLGLHANKVVDIYAQHGNQVAASLPTALHEAVEQGRAKMGDRLLLLGTGAGVSLAGLVWDL